MGLDTVEMVMAVEDEFQIEISDAAAEQMLTVGHMIDYISVNYINVSSERIDELWQELDERFVSVTGKSPSSYPLATKVFSLLTSGKEVLQWQQLNLRPSARRSKLVVNGIILTVMVAMLGMVLVQLSWLIIVPLLLGLLWLLLWCTRWAVRLPDESAAKTLGDLVWWQPKSKNDCSTCSREEILKRLIPIITDQLGVKPEQVTEDANFVEDLGVA